MFSMGASTGIERDGGLLGFRGEVKLKSRGVPGVLKSSPARGGLVKSGDARRVCPGVDGVGEALGEGE